MATTLVLDSSVPGDGSVSRLLVEEAVQQLSKNNLGANVIRRDLGATPIPNVTTANVAGIKMEPSTDAELAVRGLSDELIAELRAADTVVIGAPMYNFRIPTGLRASETFRHTEAGPQSLLTDKRVIVLEPRGDLYCKGPAQAIDFQKPYLRTLLGLIGLGDVTLIHAEKIGFGPKARETALASAKQVLAVAA